MVSGRAIWILHPSRPLVFVRSNGRTSSTFYGVQPDNTLSRIPLFMKDALADPKNVHAGQGAARFTCIERTVRYQANRNATRRLSRQEGFCRAREQHGVWAIDEKTGEPKLIQT